MHSLSFDRNGFTVLPVKSRITLSECEDPEQLRTRYLDEVESSVCELFGSDCVEVLGYQVWFFVACNEGTDMVLASQLRSPFRRERPINIISHYAWHI
jgi:hypothetical protein